MEDRGSINQSSETRLQNETDVNSEDNTKVTTYSSGCFESSPDFPTTKRLVKSLHKENTILIQKNPKSKIKLMVIDKYRQMIQNSSATAESSYQNKQPKHPNSGLSSNKSPQFVDSDNSASSELSNLTFNVAQFNPKHQKYAIVDSFKPRASSLSNPQLAIPLNRSLRPPRRHIFVSDSNPMGSAPSKDKASEGKEAVGESDVYSEGSLTTRPPKHAGRQSKERKDQTATLYRGITPAARRKGAGDKDNPPGRLNRSASKTFVSIDESKSFEVMQSQDESSIGSSSHASKFRAKGDNQSEKLRRSAVAKSGDRRSSSKFEGVKTGNTPRKSGLKRPSSYGKDEKHKGTPRSGRKEGNISKSFDVSNGPGNGSRFNISGAFELSCGDEDMLEGNDNARKKRQVSSPLVVESTWKETNEDRNEARSSSNRESHVRVYKKGIMDDEATKGDVAITEVHTEGNAFHGDTGKSSVQLPQDFLNSPDNQRMSRSTTRYRNSNADSFYKEINKGQINVPGNQNKSSGLVSQTPSAASHGNKARSRSSSSQKTNKSNHCTPTIKGTPVVQPVKLQQRPPHQQISVSPPRNISQSGGYVKRGKPRMSTTIKPIEIKTPATPKKTSNASEASGNENNQEEEEEVIARPPLPANARVPPVITDPSVYPYDATEKCIKTLAKHPLDIDFGAWHRNVAPQLPPLVRNPQTGLRYVDRQNLFYMCRGNNTVLIENHFLKNLKWNRTEEKGPNFKFKWVQCVNQIDFDDFRESEQVVNHISNIGCLTTKIGLVESLRAYERHLQRTERKPSVVPDMLMTEFFNETYKLNNKTEYAAFKEVYKPGETWICKPNGLNQGIGIFLIRSLEELETKLTEYNSKKTSPYKQRSHNYDRMIQRYIERPLLLDNRKIDIRAYMLIASTAPFVVLYHPGYIRLCIDEYRLEDNNLISHLNNQYIQKKDARYKKMKDDTVWSYEQANDYVNKHYMKAKGIEEDWWYKTFEKQAKRIMLHCFQAVKCTLKSRMGTFDLLGFDFMIDENMKVYLIEINVNPALATNCQVLDQVIPPIVMESCDIVLEIWEKARRGLPICPIQSRQNMEVLFNETTASKYKRSPHSAKLTSNFNVAGSNVPNPAALSNQNANQTKNSARTKSQSPSRESFYAG